MAIHFGHGEQKKMKEGRFACKKEINYELIANDHSQWMPRHHNTTHQTAIVQKSRPLERSRMVLPRRESSNRILTNSLKDSNPGDPDQVLVRSVSSSLDRLAVCRQTASSGCPENQLRALDGSLLPCTRVFEGRESHRLCYCQQQGGWAGY